MRVQCVFREVTERDYNYVRIDDDDPSCTRKRTLARIIISTRISTVTLSIYLPVECVLPWE